MPNLSGVSSVTIAVAAGAVVLFAAVFAVLRGYGGDPVERLAGWARTRGLSYVAPEGLAFASGAMDAIAPPADDGVLATFAGVIEGLPVEVVVARVARRLGSDLPPRLTTTTAGTPGGAVECVLQPAAWVLDRDGNDPGERRLTGDRDFDERWAARGEAGAVARAVTQALRQRLLAADADGLVIELSARAVAIPMPGVCTDVRELDRRVVVATSLLRSLLA